MFRLSVNPEIDESLSLHDWYNANEAGQIFKAHPSSSGGVSVPAFNRVDIRSLGEIKQAGYGMPDKPDTSS